MTEAALTTQYVRATIAYDGTDFLGFQWQPQGRTVQGVLEAAFHSVTRAACRVVGSGRTDAGVHARGQVIATYAPWRHSLPDLQRALNAVLPGDLAVLDVGYAEQGWHPRFSARSRRYRYTVLNRPLRSPLERRYSHLVTKPLDLAKMEGAAAALIGEHDFASFGRPTQGESTVRRIISAHWQGEGETYTFDVVGNAFLRSMVRSVVGTLLQVGMGLWPVEQVAAVLEARDRARAAPPAPACGLCLMHVEYE